MREKLKAAIYDIDIIDKEYNSQSPEVRTPIRLLLAAARAYACEECGGDGLLENDESCLPDSMYRCPACKQDREVADGE